MLDLKTLRADPEAALAAMERRGDETALSLIPQVLEADETRRRVIGEVESLKAERNTASKAIGEAKSRGEDATSEIAAMGEVAAKIKALDAELAAVERTIDEHLHQIPNIPDDRVPPGEEGEGPTMAEWGTPRTDGVPPHWELGASHGHAGGLASGYPGGSAPFLDLERGAYSNRIHFTVRYRHPDGPKLARVMQLQFVLK